jgi:cysteine desulfurase / selenocysteine lyase
LGLSLRFFYTLEGNMDSSDTIIYLDNAATTFPKPPRVLEEMLEAYTRLGVSPGRGSYDLSMEAEERVMGVRRQISQFFGGSNAERVIFSYNATDALNTLIQGLIKPGAHVVSSRLEHNSVLRPLHHLSEQGIIGYDLVPFNPDGLSDPASVAKAIRPNTCFVILTHASNVLGTVQPVEQIGEVCRKRGVPLLLDVTQTAGLIPIRMDEWGVSAVAFTGHKSLLGPTGIGGLVLSPGLDVKTTRFGGTGKDSSSLLHTQTYPHRLEAGTINIAGVFGLSAGLRYISGQGMEKTRAREMTLAKRLHEGLSAMKGIRVYPSKRPDDWIPVLMCTVDDKDPEDVSSILDGDFGIAARAGLHCAPLVHQDLGTAPKGGVRFSLGPFNTDGEIDKALEAMAAISSGK